jgi:hypothetical protein
VLSQELQHSERLQVDSVNILRKNGKDFQYYLEHWKNSLTTPTRIQFGNLSAIRNSTPISFTWQDYMMVSRRGNCISLCLQSVALSAVSQQAAHTCPLPKAWKSLHKVKNKRSKTYPITQTFRSAATASPRNKKQPYSRILVFSSLAPHVSLRDMISGFAVLLDLLLSTRDSDRKMWG